VLARVNAARAGEAAFEARGPSGRKSRERSAEGPTSRDDRALNWRPDSE